VSAEKPRRLGRGLEALIPVAGASSAGPTTDLQRIRISRVRPNPFQPRREFPAAELAELEASLKASGLLQPITVRPRGDAYELIAGERRLRAATNLGWTDISAIVRDFDDRTMLVLALVENLQRANLNALEEARGYRRLIDDFQLTQQQVADAVGKDRTTVTNLLRVLTLPVPVQEMVERGELSSGHARALLALASAHSMQELASEAVSASMSVRALEQRVRELNAGDSQAGVPLSPDKQASNKRSQQERADSPAVRRVEDQLRSYLQTDVRLRVGEGERGVVEIAFYSNDDLDRLLDMILRENRRDF
jgi:ParB family transcriptional regulator, chromosome partitioning protein